MNEQRSLDEYDKEILESFQVEIAQEIAKGGSEDLRHIDVNYLGNEEVKAFGLLEQLNDGAITMEMFRDELNKYQGNVSGSEEKIKSINHYIAWLRNQAMSNLMREQ